MLKTRKIEILIGTLITALFGWCVFMIWYTWNMTTAERFFDPVCYLSAPFVAIVYYIWIKISK